MAAGLAIRLLGELEVLRGDRLVALPPSKKTRALLAYLVVSGRPHRRERLCSLFWDVADDPRGALRWSLSKLRALLDERGASRIVADRDSVAFDAAGAQVDLLEVKAFLADGVEALATEKLISLVGCFRGELLEGLELSDFDEFQAWCVAERELFRRQHAAALDVLVARLGATPEEALPHARSLVRVDPLRPAARMKLLELLVATGRRDEAEQHYRAALRLLDELGPKGGAALRAAWAALAAKKPVEPEVPVARQLGAEPEAPAPSRRDARLVGRRTEVEVLARALDRVVRSKQGAVLSISGEPGVGKTRLADWLVDEARGRGALVLQGASFEAEAGRPFGAWIDALRQLPVARLEASARASLAPLLPELGGSAEGGRTREQLFGAVQSLVEGLAGSAPVVLVFQDVQWLDEPSSGLVHYVARTSRLHPVLIAMTARAGELADNDAVCSLVRSLRRDRLLTELELEPLSADETSELLADLVPAQHIPRMFEQSAGNPLYALELARSLPDPDGAPPRGLTRLISDRLQRLPPEAAEILRWGAVLGQVFQLERLTAVTSRSTETLVTALEMLELHALIRPVSSGYAFAHDIVRRVVYFDLSEPRRRLMHSKVAQVLGARGEPDGPLAADIAHHAALGGDALLAARACVAAGRRCLRLFAGVEAHQLARRGLRHAEALEEPLGTELKLELAEIEAAARRPADPQAMAREIEALAERAEALGSVQHARLGFHVASHLSFEGGEWSAAQRSTLRAEEVSREGGGEEQVTALAEAGRCLAMLERDLGHAERLLTDALGRVPEPDAGPLALSVGLGMLRLHQGSYEAAYELFQRALAAARRSRHRAGEFQALEYLVMLELERGRPGRAAELCAELLAIGEKLREGSEAPFARALHSLAGKLSGSDAAARELELALAALRAADAKHRLAYVLTRTALFDARTGDAEAEVRAEEALEIARLLDRPSEIALAHVALAEAALTRGDQALWARRLDALKKESLRGVSAHTEQAIARLFETTL